MASFNDFSLGLFPSSVLFAVSFFSSKHFLSSAIHFPLLPSIHLISSPFLLLSPDICQIFTSPLTLLFSSSNLSPFLEKHRQCKWAKAAARDSLIDKSLLASDKGLLSSNHCTNWLKCLLVFMHSHSRLLPGLLKTRKNQRILNEWKLWKPVMSKGFYLSS